MSSRSRASRRVSHAHCDSCYTRRCRARVEASVCCALTSCRLLCGALFHLCKEEDHLLLCPNVRVPCLNAEYGCLLQMPRSSRAEHLQICPASVVSCSMEWLRWPVDETNPHSFRALQENLLKENNEQEEALDLGLALVNQSELYAHLKMKPLYPELMEEEEKEEEMKEDAAIGGLVNGYAEEYEAVSMASPEGEPNDTEELGKMSRSQMLGLFQERCSRVDMMFGMERGACTAAEASQNNITQKDNPGGKEKEQANKEGGAAAKTPERNTTIIGHAPWQEGVLERLGRDLTPQEYNMYIVHHGRMLVSFGQIPACTPREKDFVYGSLEPIEIKTVRTFKNPDSYCYRRRVQLCDTAARAQSKTQEVDTSDLGGSEDDWFSDEATTTLLGYAERELMGHKISEEQGADGLIVDEGTQTYSFHTAPFKSNTSLANVMVDRPLKLHLQLQAESVSTRHNRNCMFTFICGHSFHRREFPTHVRNVHSEIQTGLSGWFEQRCPLAYLGCTYSCRRFQPSTHKATVIYNQELKTFNLRPTTVCPVRDDSQAAGKDDTLSSLPYEVLCHVASFLDSMSLSQLALVSRLMRQVCSTQLQDKGMVTLRWQKKTYSCGKTKWRAKPVWEFSHLFSKVDSWHMADITSISAHLKVCPYYEKHTHSAPVLLHSMRKKQKSSKAKQSLVNHFTRNNKKL